MYPSFAIGSTLSYGVGNALSPRIKAGETYDVNVGTSDGNTNIFLMVLIICVPLVTLQTKV